MPCGPLGYCFENTHVEATLNSCPALGREELEERLVLVALDGREGVLLGGVAALAAHGDLEVEVLRRTALAVAREALELDVRDVLEAEHERRLVDEDEGPLEGVELARGGLDGAVHGVAVVTRPELARREDLLAAQDLEDARDELVERALEVRLEAAALAVLGLELLLRQVHLEGLVDLLELPDQVLVALLALADRLLERDDERVVDVVGPRPGQEKGDSTSLQRGRSARARSEERRSRSRPFQEMITRPKVSQNEWKTTEI